MENMKLISLLLLITIVENNDDMEVVSEIIIEIPIGL